MPLIQVLSTKKKTKYEQPPIFSAKERKHFFRLPASLRMKVHSFLVVTNKVGFRLMFGYFLAFKKFYQPEHFRSKDIQYLCKQYGILPFGFDTDSYKGSTYTRHRQIILEHFAYQNYQPQIHNPLVIDAIKEQVYSWEEYRFIIKYLSEWLEWRRIEKPSYYTLQVVITQSIRNRNKKINQQFKSLLCDHHKETLDQLLTKSEDSGRDEYVLTTLQELDPSDAPAKIKLNIEKLQTVQSIFEVIQPLLEKLGLNNNAVRHLGEIVLHAKSWHIARREEVDRYLHLAAFAAYQRAIFEDWMVRTFLGVCTIAFNKAANKERERLFQNRKRRKKLFNQVIGIAQDSKTLLKTIRELAWSSITAIEKEQQLQILLPQELTIEEETDVLQEIQEDVQELGNDNYYRYLIEGSQKLQNRVSPIIKQLTFNTDNSDSSLLTAIHHFREKDGVITKTAPTNFLKEEDESALTDDKDKFQVSLYKMLLFQEVTDAIKRGSLNLKYSYKYKAMDDYLIPKNVWEQDKEALTQRANLNHLKDVKARINDFKKMIAHHFKQTNDNILKGKNKFFRKSKKNNYHVVTPKVEKESQDVSLFPSQSYIPISEVLSTVNDATNFLDFFQHLQPAYRKERPPKSVFFAGITAFGCNLGIPAMNKAAAPISHNQLENMVNWFFNVTDINKANTVIVNFTTKLPLANLQRKKQGELRTSSDGQKIKVYSDKTIFANHSAKYFNKGKGVVAYSFVDERYIPFYSVIIDSSVREAAYVLDGLLHNEAIKSDIHTTDTHGYTEVLFGLMDMLGFGFSPNIAKIQDQHLYTFKEWSIPAYRDKGYLILPVRYIKEDLIENNWDEFLRLVVSLKLKYCTASQVFRRFNSYSRQHPLYAVIKEYGRMPKTLHVLRFMDDLELRQDSRKSGNAIESSNRFSKAIFFANGGEMIFLTRTEQQIAEACKRLIKNAIICWNYLYLTRKVQKARNQKEAEELLKVIKNSTANVWQHIYFNGTYDFSDEILADSFNLLHSQNYDIEWD